MNDIAARVETGPGGHHITFLKPGMATATVDADGDVTVKIDMPVYDWSSAKGKLTTQIPTTTVCDTYYMGRGEGVFYYPDGSVAKIILPDRWA